MPSRTGAGSEYEWFRAAHMLPMCSKVRKLLAWLLVPTKGPSSLCLNRACGSRLIGPSRATTQTTFGHLDTLPRRVGRSLLEEILLPRVPRVTCFGLCPNRAICSPRDCTPHTQVRAGLLYLTLTRRALKHPVVRNTHVLSGRGYYCFLEKRFF